MNLNQITVPSLDLKKSIPFYQKLGLELIVAAAPHYARFVCPDGSSTFFQSIKWKQCQKELAFMFISNVII